MESSAANAENTPGKRQRSRCVVDGASFAGRKLKATITSHRSRNKNIKTGKKPMIRRKHWGIRKSQSKKTKKKTTTHCFELVKS